MFKALITAGVMAGAALVLTGGAQARELKAVGVTVGTLGNPYFIAVGKGVTDAVHEINPAAKVTISSADYDLNKQFTQIDNFISAGVDLILVNAADPRAIAPARKRAPAAGEKAKPAGALRPPLPAGTKASTNAPVLPS